jgi:V/A-type H+-transporting ATPase subunit K
MEPLGLAIAIFGVVCAVALAGFGSAIGIGYSSRAATGVMSEDPGNFGRYLLLIVLPGTQGIYGFITGFLALLWLNFIGNEPIRTLTVWQGLQWWGACMPVALAGFVSAIHQGKVCSDGIYMVAKQPQSGGRAMVMGVAVELYAILGLVTSLFCLLKLKGV